MLLIAAVLLSPLEKKSPLPRNQCSSLNKLNLAGYDFNGKKTGGIKKLRELVLLYGGICLAALALKLGIKMFTSLMGKKSNHEQEHSVAHFIKLIIIILLAILMIFLSRDGEGFANTGSFTVNSESTANSSAT